MALLIRQQATPAPGLNGRGKERMPLINYDSGEAMARMIGSVRVVLNRHIQDLTQMGLISAS